MNLNFDSHILIYSSYKISRTVEIISKIRYYLPEKALLKIYFMLRYIPTYCTAILFRDLLF